MKIVSLILLIVVTGYASPEKDAPDPVRSPSPEVAQLERQYSLQAGDTLGKVAAKFNLRIDQLVVLNPEIDPTKLKVGQRLRIKKEPDQPPATALRSTTAKSAYEVTPPDRRFLAEILEAVERKDTTWIAAHSSLPMIVISDGKRRLVKKENELADVLAPTLTEDLRIRIQSAAKLELFCNWQGVMVGDGIIWFDQYHVSKDASLRYVILAFGNFAFQPEEAVEKTEATSGR